MVIQKKNVLQVITVKQALVVVKLTCALQEVIVPRVLVKLPLAHQELSSLIREEKVKLLVKIVHQGSIASEERV